ncbi:ABC transporter substrate-binding protein [Aquamicrobium sp. LC103]|uniref:ABC transporter substrate-binding protein n=1 Tax=Aquamicrobium sp. LC103 TaxID=1120658 RepID=UPI00063E8A31|nr:ABC transporter substrate-binding protein [Aquamicrobium sp. LC103]TKT82557.1 ABC transporter substrate-binding protein [Aquamicrobium sp. LC103]
MKLGNGASRLGTVLAVLMGMTSIASAQEKVVIGCTATTDCASAAIAVEEGIFEKNGLDAELILIGLNSNIPAGILSNSLQIGGPTPSVFLQATDGGLDLVAVAGASSTAKETADTVAIVTRAGVEISSAKDLAGKKVGAPGIGAFLHVLFQQWLIENDVDPKSVQFVEVTFPTMSDVLQSGAVDAVVAAEPFLSRILSAGTGKVMSHYLEDLPEHQPQILYASTREWADSNPEALAAFRASIDEAAKIVNADPDKARGAISRFTKIPPEVLANMKLSVSDPVITSEQLAWWADVMNQQNMLQNEPDVDALVQK